MNIKIISNVIKNIEDVKTCDFVKKGSKIVFMPIGFDLTTQPFPIISSGNASTLIGKLKLVLIALMQRHRISSVDSVWASPFPVLLRSLEKVRNGKIAFNGFVPLPIHYGAHMGVSKETKEMALDILEGVQDKFLVFFPGRLMVTKSSYDLQTGQTKGADKAVQGFLDFVRFSGANAQLLLIDHSISPDRQRVFDLVTELEGHDLVKWIKSPTSNKRLNNTEMASIYQVSDVILGDFGSGWFGQTAIESGAHGKPFISFIEPAFMVKHFQLNPFVSARDAEEISHALLQLFESSQLRKLKGQEMELWFKKFLSRDALEIWYRAEILKAMEI